MLTLPQGFSAMAAYPQFIVCQLVPDSDNPGKTLKWPLNVHTKKKHNAHDPTIWMTAEAACREVSVLGAEYRVGFVFTAQDPFFFIDIDNCALFDTTGNFLRWSPIVDELCASLPGAAIELSQSGRGLHIFGRGTTPANRRKKDHTGQLFDLYTEKRFVALTGVNLIGDVDTEHTAALQAITEKYLIAERGTLTSASWTTEPVPAWRGPADDNELIDRAMNATPSAHAAFGDGLTFADLWQCNAEKLAVRFPPDGNGDAHFNASSADYSLALRLAFWTGKDCERIRRLMWMSKLKRDKWEARGDYLNITILNAIGECAEDVLGSRRFNQQKNSMAIASPNEIGPFHAPGLLNCDARDGTKDTRPLTELGNGLRLFDLHGAGVRYVYDAERWIIWNDSSWQWDVDGSALRSLAASLPEAIYTEGVRYIRDADFYAKWARKSQEKKIIEHAVSLLSDFQQLRLPLAHIDAEDFIVGFNQARNVVDLTVGTIRAAAIDDYVTKSLNVANIGDIARAGRWIQFLEEVFNADRDLIDWLQRFTGYLLTGSTREHIFLFCYGLGANGKSVFIEVLKHIMGDYTRTIAPETLSDSKRQAGGASPDLADLIGCRLVLCSETEDNTPMAESLVKSLVAGDSMTVRQLYSAPMQFTPKFKLVMAGNHKPIIRGSDNGIWRRVRMVPFNRTFAPDERDPQLLAKLKAESPHILAWMVAGCIEWQRRGLNDTPVAIRQATDAYQEDQDIIGRWLGECTSPSAQNETSSSDIYGNYKFWCFDNGLKPSSSAVLGRRLAERGVKVRQSNGKRFYCGIALIPPQFNTVISASAASAAKGPFT